MSRIRRIIAVALTLGAVTANADGLSLRKRLVAGDGWVGYHVAMVAGVGAPCCHSGGIGESEKSKCELDTGKGIFLSDSAGSNRSGDLSIYWHASKGKLDRVRAFAADCPVSSREAIHWIEPVDANESVAATAAWIGDAMTHRDSMELAALALQAEPSATMALVSLAAPERSIDVRKDAIFWLGHARGTEGANFVEKVAIGDSRPELREHAVFALSQSGEKDAYERVRRISRKDNSTEVRSKALFWMAQMQDPRAADDITAALSSETSDKVREQAVFALSQLGEGKAPPALIAIIRGNHPRAVKEKALFWLGQSESDEAMAFLDEMLTK